jgi:hypothetical protein
MRQIAYPAAVGSCVLGAGASPARAAEWSITPNYSASVDYESNRRLDINSKSSDASVLAVDLRFKRAMEDMDFTIEPRYAFRRYTDPSLGNGDDRSVDTGFNRVGERSNLNLTASYWDQSALTTEFLQTATVNTNIHRRQQKATAAWNWNQTERRTLISQLSYTDVSYYGPGAQNFPGFRYPSGTLGERFSYSEHGSLTLSAYGSAFSSSSNTPGNSSHSVGLEAEVIHSFSERTDIDASIGESTRVLNGRNGQGTDASLTVNHSLFLGKVSLGYTRSLVPYGGGFLVQQQQYTAAFARPLTPYLDWSLGFFRVQNNQTAVLLRVDRPNYNSLAATLNWRPAETWSIGARVEAVRTQVVVFEAQNVSLAPQNVNAWRSSITFTWTPFPKSRSW